MQVRNKSRNLRSLTIAAATAGVLALASCAGTSQPTEPTGAPSDGDIIIGLNLELTGTGSFLGQGQQAGAEAAAAAINEAGGINGRQIKVIARDNQSDPATTISAISELAREGAVAVIGPGFGQDCMAAAPVYDREDLVGFCLSAVDLPEGTHMFGVGIDYTTMEEAIAEQLAADGVKRVGLLAANDTSGQDTIDAFVPVAEKLGIVVDVERFNGPATDLTPQLLALSRNNPDMIRLQATGPDAILGVSNVRSLGITTPTWLPNSAASFYFASQVAGDVDAGNILTWIPALVSPTGTEDHPNQAEQINNLLAALPEADTISASGWDAMQVVADALSRAAGTDSADLIEALQTMDTYFGGYSVQQITADDHRNASDEGTLIPAFFTPEGAFTLRDGS